ncbi:MAG: hypothetical protein NVS2B14_17980 [Chamaesiphon sp.]
MNKPSPFDCAERIESIKAGILAALSVSLVYCIATITNTVFLAQEFEALAGLQITSGVSLMVRVSFASLSGFLFGITYRYVIREDRNSHLNDGAVLAFGLVRALAQIEEEVNLPDVFWSAAVLSAESILLFAIARLTLDLAMHFCWLKRFKSG